MSPRLVLGTVQFGMPYGIANRTGQVSLPEVRAILEAARVARIDTLDTAVAYREAEQRLGEAGVYDFRVVTKLPPRPADCADAAAWVAQTVEQSLRRLGVSRLHGLLLHRARDLLDADGRAILGKMRELRAAGHVSRIGVSIYDPEELDEVVGIVEPEIVQGPFNVFDRRLLTSGWLGRLAAAGVEVHVRSVFLQGLLLMPAAQRPAQFAPWRELFARWDAWLLRERLSPLRACLAFALSQRDVDGVVFGVESRAQLDEIIAAAVPGVEAPAELSTTDLDLINPGRWKAA
jgi:aryl-alcohol dehydrogenase-like predicted oxidoreductase